MEEGDESVELIVSLFFFELSGSNDANTPGETHQQ
jgi:hypothetical protein